MADYDVIVIGAGPGGYVAAIRCAQLGLKTACIDRWVDEDGKPRLGGVCLNVGCIPSKALLDSSHHFHSLTHQFPAHGITVENPRLDLSVMMKRKQSIVNKLTAGVATLFIKNKVEWIKGSAKLLSNNTVEVTPLDKAGGTLQLVANHIIIATGSKPIKLKIAPHDRELIVDSTDALSFAEVPKRLGVVGAGVVGLELGSVWSRLGSKVTILNRNEKFLRGVDQEIARAAYRELQAQGLTFHLGMKINEVKKNSGSVTVVYEDAAGRHSEEFDKLLIATGRKPNSRQLCQHEIGLKMNQRGFIEVDDLCRTSLQGVYAIGDVVRGPMLAHKASEEGVAVAEMIAGQTAHVDFNKVPWVIYTWPEIAWVGKTTEQLNENGIAHNAGVFPLFANGRAMAMNEKIGMVKILSDAGTDEILGVHIYAPNASELIGEAVVAMEFSASAEDLARTVHAHPTLSEALHEAALACQKRAINI
ncbi:MAG: dihydrolipoyl dehydrogenase [Gammaproteobacteria bacterium]|nr:dihydrolipoyl dehydrogenase [Gammaproteobacteria bacterium]